MGMLANDPHLADAIGLPTYIVDTVQRRDLGSGIASIINCRTINGVIVPQCEIVIASHHLMTIGRGASDFAAEVYKRHQMELIEAIGRRH